MSDSVEIGDFAGELMKCLEEYTEDVTKGITKAVAQTTKETVKELKSTAPKKTGDYAKDFAQKKGDKDSEKVVYNRNHYQLTHLLEHGHAKRNGGRTKPIVHIEPVEQKAIKNLENRIEEIIKKGG